MWGSVEDYRGESEMLLRLARERAAVEVRTLLDVGCGAGKNLAYFAKELEVTGLDLSEDMLDLARRAVPGAELVRGDMRDFDLGRRFDVVHLNDALPHLTRREELHQAFECAARHLEPGGVLLATAELTKELFVQNASSATPGAPEMQPPGIEVVFVENYFDPDPEDETFETTILYLIRKDGRLTIERDDWICGLFPMDAWWQGFEACGLEAELIEDASELDGTPLFVCTKPAGPQDSV